MIGVVLSLLVFLYKSMRPSVVSSGQVEDEALRCRDDPRLRGVPIRGPGPFRRSPLLRQRQLSGRQDQPNIMRTKKQLSHIVIVANGINDIDASGEETLSLLVDRIRSAGVDVLDKARRQQSVMKVFVRTHFPAKLGEDHLFPTMEKAITTVHQTAHVHGQEEACPPVDRCPDSSKPKQRRG